MYVQRRGSLLINNNLSAYLVHSFFKKAVHLHATNFKVAL